MTTGERLHIANVSTNGLRVNAPAYLGRCSLGSARCGGDAAELPLKAVYEIGYELNNRPNWIRVPLRGVRQILEG